MSTSRKIQEMSVEEYLASEERASVRHEYIDGRVFAMSGVTKRHNVIAGNLFSILRNHVRGSRCRAYVSDVKARVQATNSFYYPDLMVSCEKYDEKSVYSDCPVLLVEVLSRSSAMIDRREKVLAYRQIEALQEYLIVHQTKKKVELHRKNDRGNWEIVEFVEGAEPQLDSIPVGPLRFPLESIYEDVDWEQDLAVHEELDDEWFAEAALDW
jgi:Uma2 family endonuclease